MKKLKFLLLFFSLAYSVSYAQRNLEVKEKTEGLSIFTDKDTSIDAGQAGAVISCPITLNLTFASNVDRTIDVYNIDERGDVRYYYLRFIVGRFRGASYDNRILEVIVSGFRPLRFPLNLSPSESKHFEIFDPNATVGVGCFYQFFNEGIELFKQAFYIEAQEKYRTSLECTDAPPNVNVRERMSDIDTILVYRAKAYEAFDAQDFKLAMECYERIYALNNDDGYINQRLSELRLQYFDQCNNYFTTAETYYANRQFNEAREMYQMILNQNCPKIAEASQRLNEMLKFEIARADRAQVINYEFAQNTPIGISVGRYWENKIRYYVSMRFNLDIWGALMKNNDEAEKPEVNVSGGLNVMTIRPIWVFAGIGYTGVGTWDWVEKTEKYRLHLHDAISPEIGLLGKIGPAVLRYTFQYRFPFDGDYLFHIGRTKHVFGIGVCF